MRISLFTALGFASLSLPTLAAVDDAVPAAQVASPQYYQVLLDNAQVLVLKMVLKPGEADRLHRHNNETVYFQQGGQLTITEEGREPVVVDIPDGHVMWHAAWRHQVTNTGTRDVTAIVVEKKPQD